MKSHSLAVRSLVVTLVSSFCALVALVSMVGTTAACSGVCSADEEASCREAHTSCGPACGNGTVVGASGLPEPDPAYEACVKSCNDKQCACLDSCGTTCNSGE